MRSTYIHIFPCLLLACIALSCQQSVDDMSLAVSRCQDMPKALTACASFCYDGKGYILCGRDSSGRYTNKLYCYDPVTDCWTDLGSTPLKPRVRARAVVVDDYVYAGLGFNGYLLIDSAYLSDWWRFSTSTNTWTRMADYPCDRTVGPVVTSDGTNIYAAYGGKQNFERWVFQYEPTADRWHQIHDGLKRGATYPPRAHSASGAFCGGQFFIGTGYYKGSDSFWTHAELSADSVIWHKCTPVPGKRHNATATHDDRYIYLAGGHYYGGTVTNGKLYNDILRYDTGTDRWVRLGYMPNDGRENMVSWIIGNVLYIGLGSDKDNKPCKELYKIAL